MYVFCEVWGKVMFLQVSVHGEVSVWCHFPSGCLVPCSFQGVSVWGVSFWGVFVREDPPYGGERVVRILLECFLVQNI